MQKEGVEANHNLLKISESHVPESKPARGGAGTERNKNGRYFHGMVTFVN